VHKSVQFSSRVESSQRNSGQVQELGVYCNFKLLLTHPQYSIAKSHSQTCTHHIRIIAYNVYRKAERDRIQSYQQDLEDMKQRVKQRPLLFEQAAQVCSSLTALF